MIAFFARCKDSTEFHFKDVESQLETIERDFGRSEVREGVFIKKTFIKNLH